MLCDIKVYSSLEKSQKLELRDYSEKIVMIISAMSTDSNGYLEKVRLEHYKDGQKVFTNVPKNYLSELILEIVVNKKYLSDNVEYLYDSDPILLSTYDPMSNLFN
jgi:aminopeptidase C